MARAPFQVLVFPFRISGDSILYALLRRDPGTGGYWQGVAGGGEGSEAPLETARRETWEETGISTEMPFVQLESMIMLPVVNVCGFRWGPDILVIPEYAFGVQVEEPALTLSDEHTEYVWLPIDEAMDAVQWDSNRNALWELNYRILNGRAVLV